MATAQVRVLEESINGWTGFDSLVQLISVDGQRTLGCPYWELVADVDASQLRDLYTDMAVVRRLDAEAMALQRQGELALWAPLLGQEAAQVGSARALRPDDFVFPSYREHGVAYCRGVDPVAHAAPVAGHRPLRMGPRRLRDRHAGHRRRVAGAPRHGLRAGHHARRRHARRRSPTSVTAPRARATSPRPSASPPATRCPSSSSARTTSGPSRSRPACSRTSSIASAGPGLRHPRDRGGRQRRPGRPRGHPAGARSCLRRSGAHPDRGRHLSHGPAHHVGRSHPVPDQRRGGGVARQGPPGAAAGAAARRGTGRRAVRGRPSSEAARGSGGGAASRLPGHGGSRAGRAVRPRLRGAASLARRGARRLRGLSGRLRRGRRDGDHVAGQGAQHRACAGPWSATPRSS